MPIIWRYLLSNYLKVLFLCVVSFILILMTTRLDEIAHFATLGPEVRHVLLFTVYQIPYVLPIALPISALISSILLIQRLSTTHELTAMRACGISLRMIIAPLLLAGGVLAIANFYIISEMATHSHLETSLIKNELRSINPLLLLHNKHLMKMKGIYFDTMGASKLGETASEVVIAAPNKRNNRINLLFAEKLNASTSNLEGKGLTLVSSVNSENKERFDQIMLENIGQASTSVSDFSHLLQKKVWTLNNDHLRLPLLLVRLKEQQKDLKDAKAENQQDSTLKVIKKSINKIYSEILRRFSASFSVFTFTLMGAAFGISISRQRSSKGIILVVLLATLYLFSFFMAKGTEYMLALSASLYLAPHALIIGSSIWALKRATKGIE